MIPPEEQQYMFGTLNDEAFAPSLYELQMRQNAGPGGPGGPFDGPPPGMPFGIPMRKLLSFIFEK